MPREDEEPSPVQIAEQLAVDLGERKVASVMLVVAYEDGRAESYVLARDSNDAKLLELVRPVEVATEQFQERVKTAARRGGMS